MALLELDSLRKSYAGRRVVDGVSIQVDAGQIVGLLGPNGAGKTTSFRMAVGLITPEVGAVRFGGRDITRMPMYQRARAGLGYLAQERSIFRGLSVEGNILAVLELVPGLRRRERKLELERLLDELDLKRLRRSRSVDLSGGEKRRLEITRALAIRPKILLLDEPFSAIDPIAVEDIQKIIVRLRRDHGLGILLTDHSVRETLSITDRAYVIHEGKVFAEGPADVLVNDPKVRQHYLGENFEMTTRRAPDPGDARPAPWKVEASMSPTWATDGTMLDAHLTGGSAPPGPAAGQAPPAKAPPSPKPEPWKVEASMSPTWATDGTMLDAASSRPPPAPSPGDSLVMPRAVPRSEAPPQKPEDDDNFETVELGTD